MPEGEELHSAPDPNPPRRHSRWRLLVLAAVLLGLAVASLSGPAQDRSEPPETPLAVAPPPGLDLPPVAAPGPVAVPLPGGALDRAAVSAVVDRASRDRRVGRRLAVAVARADGGLVHSRGPEVVTPASSLKLITSLAALEALGPERRFTTTVSAVPGAAQGSRTIVIRGGGDPLLEARAQPRSSPDAPPRADLDTLARRTAQALRSAGSSTRVRLEYDASLFTGPAVNPAWEPDYVPDDVVSPISALWVAEGRVRPGFAERSADPAAAAARAFVRALRRHDVSVQGAPRPVSDTVAAGAVELAQVSSAPVVDLVQHLLETSDNEASEVLARHVAIAVGEPASFAGGARALGQVLRDLRVDVRGLELYDGSGLSRDNRVAPRTLLDVLALGADPARPPLAGVQAGLPVAGFSGSLSDRFVRVDGSSIDPALGWVRAKTGTLTGVRALAGTVVGRDGSVMLVVAIADRIRPINGFAARDVLERILAGLAACACSR